MHGREVKRRLYNAIPDIYTWPGCRGETYGLSGLSSTARVERVLFCVTVTQAVEEYFLRHGYDLLVAHHPMRPRNRTIPNGVFHTALDFCPGGLNSFWAQVLHLQNQRPIYDQTAVMGELRTPKSFTDILHRVQVFSGPVEGMRWCPESKPIQTVAICTGLGSTIVDEVERANPDLYITGEMFCHARDTTIQSLLEMGHTRSERIGVFTVRRALGPTVQVDVAPLGVDTFSLEVYKEVLVYDE